MEHAGRLEGKVCIITGAASGIGEATAQLFSKEGARVIVADMQEDKGPLFDTVDTLKACIEIYIKMLPNIEINKEAMLDAASRGFLNATDMADYLVTKGMPFR